MQVIIKTNYDGQEAKEVMENVTSISSFDGKVALNFKDDAGHNKTQFLGLDGYTELIVR